MTLFLFRKKKTKPLQGLRVNPYRVFGVVGGGVPTWGRAPQR